MPCYNANGDITEYVDSDGSLVAHYEYSPFGEIVVQSGELASTFTHRFSTKPWCAVTSLSEYVYRKYSPSMGRWMSRDPLGDHASPGARVLHDEIATRMAYAAMMNLSMALDEELSDTERKVAVLRSLYWVAGVSKLATGDPSIGLNWSDPFTGSQLSNDPIGINGGLHLFAFCVNDPVNYLDPDGLWTIQIGVSGTAGGSTGVSGGVGVAFSYSKDHGFQYGGYGLIGIGSYIGLGAGLSMDVTVSPNSALEQLAGCALVTGGTGRIMVGCQGGGDLNIPIEKCTTPKSDESFCPKPSVTMSGGIGVGSPEGHVFLSQTVIKRIELFKWLTDAHDQRTK